MVQQQKLDIVHKIQDFLTKNANFSFIKIDKTKHQALESLRKDLKKTKSSLRVMKNTLLEKAVSKLSEKDKKFAEIKKTFFPLKERSALLLLDTDWSKGLGTFYQFSKKDTTVSFKFGLLDGAAYDKATLLQIAQLPGKDQLMANIVSSFKSPTSRTVFALRFNLMKLTNILREKSKKAN